MNLSQEFGAVYRRFISRKDMIVRDMAIEVRNHTDQAFEREGYARSSYQRWKEKKRSDGFKILHQTGSLAGATTITRSTWPTFVVVNNTEYADYHNYEAGSPHVPERHFIDKGPGESPELDRKLDQVMRKHMNYILHG